MIGAAYLCAAIAAVFATMGFGTLIAERVRQQHFVADVSDVADGPIGRLRRRADVLIMRTRLGQLLSVGLEEFGLRRFRAIDALLGVLAAMLLVLLLVGNLLSWGLAPIIALAVAPAVYLLVRREQQQRKEKFIAQMPQLARVLSNAAQAGLALRTAVELAAEELPEPASSEMGRVAQSLAVGESIEVALTNLERRLPSREVVVLVSTLVVSARAGGSLISSLRRIAETLDERKQTRREILTLLAEARSTAILIPIIGVVSLFMLRQLDEHAIDKMLADTIGRAIFLAAGILYTVGFLLFRRITRVDL
jgi:tight adherence protein B